MLLLYNGLHGKGIVRDVIMGKPTNAVIDTAAIITLTNESLIPYNLQAMIKLIKLKGIGSEIMHGRLVKGVAFEISHIYVSLDCCTVPLDKDMI